MNFFRFHVAVILLAYCPITLAQERQADQKGKAQGTSDVSAAETAPVSMPSLIQELPDYSGDIWTRSTLTGDWGGVRTDLAEKGIIIELDITQILQGNAHGGKDTNNAFRYAGSADYTLKLDTARMGLWPAGLLTLRGETQFGQSINPKVRSIMPANYDALLPRPNDPGLTTLSEAYFVQALSEKLVLLAGKVDLATLGDLNEFAGNEKTQFLNAAFRANPVLFPSSPYTSLAAGIVYLPTKWLQIGTLVWDTHGSASRTGFDTAFHAPEGITISQEWDVKIKPFGLSGNQRFGLVWTSKDSRLMDQDRRIRLPSTLGLTLLRSRPFLRFARLRGISRSLGDTDTTPDDWAIYYNFDQYLYVEPEDKTQGVGIFGRFGWSNGNANPIEEFYSFGVGGKGVIPCRNNDTFGIGYYHVNLSDDLPKFLHANSEQGVELFYNIEITPWLHITPDLQVVMDPAGGFRDRDVAVVYGLRAQMSF